MDKKTALAFGLIVLVVILWPYYYKVIMPQQEQLPQQPQTVEEIPADTTAIQSQGSRDVIPAADEMGAAQGENRFGESFGFPIDYEPELATVETPLFSLKFSTRGGVLVSAELHEYKGRNDQPVQLIREESGDNLNLTLFRNGALLDMRDLRFRPDQKELFISEDGERSLTLRAEDAQGAWVQKTFTFYGNRYDFDLKLDAGGMADLDSYYEIAWSSGMAITEPDSAQDIFYSEVYIYMDNELESFKGKGKKSESGEGTGKVEWVAQRNKYFEVAILPQTRTGDAVRFGIEAQPQLGKYRPKVYYMVIGMGGQLNETADQIAVFCGPIDQKILKAVNPALEETMNWGWPILEPFSKTILWLLKLLHSFIPNYGLVLIIFSVIIKIVVWPLTYKSTRSMSRMSVVQPKIKEIQEKYKGNPEKMNKAVMALYKEEGVNPLSGCWPMLLQMPLLYALFIVFRSTIELRGAPFILWITDLSAPDTIISLPFDIPMYGSHIALLPIFMGITQFLMSKVMITDPKQKATMYMMPIFMVLIFNRFPSGLSLYYALFNLWTYLQNMYLKRKGVIPSKASSKA